ncbi:MAG: peptidoglycan-binding protein [Nitrospira sp.]|nr:peptidoglycan-binding protein [Nitrospira sp.]
MRGGGPRSRPVRRPLRSPKRPLRPPPVRPKPPCLRPPCPPYSRGSVLWPVVEYSGLYREPYGAEPEPPTGSEHIRWVQDCLNQALGLQLPVTGLMGRETRSAVRSFQRRQGLRASGIVGPDTEEALKAACDGQREFSFEVEPFNAYRSFDAAMSHWDFEKDPRKRKAARAAKRRAWEERRKPGTGTEESMCPPQRHLKLQDRVNKICKNIPHSCDDVIGCKELRDRGRTAVSCAAARAAINQECYGGGNPGHREAQHSARRAANKCRDKYRERVQAGRCEGPVDFFFESLPGLAEVDGDLGFESPLSKAEEIELAAELLSVSSEEEVDQFLGKMFRGIGRGLKKVGRFIGKKVLPALGKGLKGLAKAALPIAGKVLGSFIPIPGVGTAIGSAIGTAVSKALELEFSGVSAEDTELEMARRFVRMAATATQQAAMSSPDVDAEIVVNEAIVSAARKHLPYFHPRKSERSGMPGTMQQGRWIRHGRQIVVLGA